MSETDETILTGTNDAKPKGHWLVLVAGVLVSTALVLWAIRPTVSNVPSVSERIVTTNNLKQIGLAFHNYDAKKGSLPLGAICDDDGKPLLSWRVALLPYLDEQELYDQFKMDEPWDSPANQPLIAKMPAVFASPKKPGDAHLGLTYYKVFVGENAVFGHTPQPDAEAAEGESQNTWSIQKLYGSTRGISNLVFAVEAGHPVIWTKPDDLPLEENGPLPNLAPLFPNEIYILMGDGRVMTVNPTHESFEAALRASIDPANPAMPLIDQ
jgi:hypothetical protein